MDVEDVFSQNEKEIMDFYGLKGSFGKLNTCKNFENLDPS